MEDPENQYSERLDSNPETQAVSYGYEATHQKKPTFSKSPASISQHIQNDRPLEKDYNFAVGKVEFDEHASNKPQTEFARKQSENNPFGTKDPVLNVDDQVIPALSNKSRSQ